jgi:undecaprenyl-diphosphatase
MLLGADRRSAAEFSFYLAMPTMAGAFAYELYKSWHDISAASPFIVAVGFVVSFISAWIVVKSFLDYVSSHGFAVFGWWRIVIGALGLIALGLTK